MDLPIAPLACYQSPMAKRFVPNIGTTGRIIRAALAVALIGGALFVSRWSAIGSGLLLVSGGFVLFEAWRGWCVMRACGIKTKF